MLICHLKLVLLVLLSKRRRVKLHNYEGRLFAHNILTLFRKLVNIAALLKLLLAVTHEKGSCLLVFR